MDRINERLLELDGVAQAGPLAVPAVATPSDDLDDVSRTGVCLSGLPGTVVGQLHSFDLLDRPMVGKVSGRAGRVFTARTTLSLQRTMLGREVVLVFDAADCERPVIVGVIQPDGLLETGLGTQQSRPTEGAVAEQGAERCLISAERDIVLRCGESSITLTRAGKIVIEGRYILSRSSGCNKMKGAAIEIN